MSKSASHNPTAAELEILQALWERGSGTVREVHEELSARRQVGYTTVLKMMQIMAEKGLLTRRDGATRAHIYSPAESQEKTRTHMVADLMEKAFQGSAESLIMHALAGKRASAEELERIRHLVEAAEKEQA